MSEFLYHIIYIFIYPLAILPFRILYYLSDFLFIIVYYLIRYRRKLARKNLTNAFPEKPLKEIRAIERAFYHHFCDYFFETIKILNISDTRMKRHFVFKNEELIQYFLNEKKPVILMMGHYGNWEWVTSIALWIRSAENLEIGQIYRPLKNKAFDRFFIKLRTRFNTINYAKNSIYREIIRMRKSDKIWLLGFISDQKPSRQNIHYWTKFLNQDTAILTGSERIAQQTGSVVCFLDVKRIKRGFYEGKIKLITDNPSETQEFEITEKYARLMEKTILRDPACYLWTHNRWKYKKEESE
jgi:Lauroyl/myristoyl acyltransferase